MAIYIPTNNTQSTKYDPAALKAQVQDYQAFGPPPRNYYTARTAGGKGVIYADHSVSNAVTSIVQGGTEAHPCSEAGMKASPRPTFAAEFTFERKSSPGFFDPPMQYVPQQVKWQYHPDGWESALAAELTKKSFNVTADQLKTSYNSLVSGPKYGEEQSYLLYHPADRGTAIFKGEPAASLVARWGDPKRGFSLIIVCPLVRADGIGWGRIYDTHNRPPIYARWSTGEQAVCEPVVLMCLPKPELVKRKESFFKDVDWFSMEPASNSAFETIWANMWKTYNIEDISALIREFGFPIVEFVPFSWTLVLLHRRIALGDQIPDENLGSWIEQYGAHLVKCGKPYNPQKHTFDFNKSKPYIGRQITYRELTGWILNPRFGNGMAQVFAQRWDDAIDALIAYNLGRNDTKWDIFRAKMKTANTPPW